MNREVMRTLNKELMSSYTMVQISSRTPIDESITTHLRQIWIIIWPHISPDTSSHDRRLLGGARETSLRGCRRLLRHGWVTKYESHGLSFSELELGTNAESLVSLIAQIEKMELDIWWRHVVLNAV